MTLTRRNVAAVAEAKPRAGSIWEEEANEYWKEMEPAKRYRRISKYAACAVLALAVGSGAIYGARAVWQHLSRSDTQVRWLPSTSSYPSTSASFNATSNSDALAVTPIAAAASDAPAAAAVVTATPVQLVPVNPAFSTNPAAADLLRARCRVRGVQTRWHEETCRKLCVRCALVCLLSCHAGPAH